MRTFFILTATIGALLAPSIASASGCVTGSTVAGGVGGALIGNSIARGGAGALLGGLGGAAIGNSVARSNCARARPAACHWSTEYRGHVAHRVRVCHR